MKPEDTVKNRGQIQSRGKLKRVLEAIFICLLYYAGSVGVFLMIAAVIFCGHASTRPLAGSAQTETEMKLWENLHILDDIYVSVRTRLREGVGAPMEGTPIETIIIKALPFLPLLFLALVFQAIILTRRSSKDEKTPQSKLK